jgi:hypothetical protein
VAVATTAGATTALVPPVPMILVMPRANRDLQIAPMVTAAKGHLEPDLGHRGNCHPQKDSTDEKESLDVHG